MVGVQGRYWRAVTVVLLAVSLFTLTAAAANPIHFHQSGGPDCFVCHFSNHAFSTPEPPAVLECRPVTVAFVAAEDVQTPSVVSTAATYGRAPPVG